MVAEGRDDLLAFVLSQQSVIDEDADKLLAYRLVHERGGNGGIDAAAQAAYHSGLAHLSADGLDGFAGEIAHFPVAGTAADFV